MIAIQVTTTPKDLAVFRVEACSPIRPVVDIDPSSFDCGSGRRVAVEVRYVLRLGRVENLDVHHDASGLGIHAHGVHLTPVGGGRREPDLLAPDDRR